MDELLAGSDIKDKQWESVSSHEYDSNKSFSAMETTQHENHDIS